jgi:hypothetical protein
MLRKNKLVSIRVLLITALRSGCLSRTQVIQIKKEGYNMAGNAVKLSVLTEEDISSVLKGYTDREIMKLMKSAGRIIG